MKKWNVPLGYFYSILTSTSFFLAGLAGLLFFLSGKKADLIAVAIAGATSTGLAIVYRTVLTRVIMNRVGAVKKPTREDSDIPEQKQEKLPPLSKADSSKGEKAAKIESLLAELNAMTGLSMIKTEVQYLINQITVRKEKQKQGMKVSEYSYHAIFSGPPGTGKTTVARLLGRIYKSLGVLKSGHFVQVSRKDLVGEYIGHSEKKTADKIEEALDGILFIDEAYSLTVQGSPNDFGRQVVEILLQAMEEYRERLIVIVAGYQDEMTGFLESNPGLASRFTSTFHFEAYSDYELKQIFLEMCRKEGYKMDPEIDNVIGGIFYYMSKYRDEKKFGNAREVRQVFQMINKHLDARIGDLIHQGQKVTKEQMLTITLPDLNEVIQKYEQYFEKEQLETSNLPE